MMGLQGDGVSGPGSSAGGRIINVMAFGVAGPDLPAGALDLLSDSLWIQVAAQA